MANESPPPATRRRTSERRRERDRNIQACFRTALPHTKLVISGEIKSLLFYEPVVNQEYIAKEERTGVRDILILDYLQWIMVIVIGTAAGIFCTLFQIVIYNIDTYNRDFVTKLIEDTSSKTNLLLYWFGYTIIPTLVSSLLVVFVEPIAEGGGIESIIAFLNGLAIPKYGHFLAIIVKYFSSLVLLIGNLPGGSEEPLIHAMSMFGVFLTKFRIPFTSIRPFLNEIHQRDLAAIGCGAGISAIFGTPIGGTLFALELLSYWSITVTFFIFISSLWAAATSKIIRVIYTWLSTSSSYVHVTYFDVKVDEDIHYSVAEFPIYILMGIIIGFAGAAMNYAHIYTHALRKFYRKNVRWKKLLRIGECIIFAIIIATGSYYLILTRLSARIPLSIHHDDKKEAILSNPENNIAAFLSQSKREVINSILTVEKDYMDTNLFLLLILLYNAALLQLGLYIPTGIIVPTLISGAIMGLLFASVVRYLYPNSDSWARLNKMAHIGAVAHCSGLTHLKFSIGVIMMESLGNPMFGIPIMFTAFITNWVVSFFSYPIYHLLMNFKGYPTLDPELIPLVIEMTARDVMTTPVTCLPLWIGANDLINFLNTDKHLGYPVINKDNITKVEAKDQIKIIGFIYRKQIQKLLESEEDMITQLTSVSAPDPDKRQVSFIRLMDPYPITVKTRTSLVRTYQLFYSLGLLHLPVVDERNYLVGVITRYDLTTIRCDMTFCASRINRGLVVHD